MLGDDEAKWIYVNSLTAVEELNMEWADIIPDTFCIAERVQYNGRVAELLGKVNCFPIASVMLQVITQSE